LKVYQVELTGAYDFNGKDGYGNVALRDSQTSDLAAGVSYNFLAIGGPNNRSFGHLGTVALALPIADVVSIGVSGRYLYQTGAHVVNAGTMDAGLAVRPVAAFIIALGASNVIDTRQEELPRYYSGSLAYLGQAFKLAADVRSTLRGDTGKPFLNVGGEYMFGQSFYLRAGYGHDFAVSNNLVSGGVGFFGEGGGVDLAYRHEFGGSQSKLLALTVRLQF
jgi:hypothetical protein